MSNDTVPNGRTGWVPRVPLTAAEQHVEFERINDHINQRRQLLERMALPTVKRLAYIVVEFHGLDPRGVKQQLAAILTRHLDATARFGFEQAQREITRLRQSSDKRPPARAGEAGLTPVYSGDPQPNLATAKLKPPKGRRGQPIHDAGRHAIYSRNGLTGVQKLAALRAQHAADEIAKVAAVYSIYETIQEQRIAAAADAASRVLHNQVLELVGETLNNGRSAGILALPDPPTFAMRSEQLDSDTCDGCDELHGQIVQVDTGEYYDLMPPSGCYGGGRCRGVYVFADGVSDVRQPGFEQAA